MVNEMTRIRNVAVCGREWWVANVSHNFAVLRQHLTVLQLIRFFPLGLFIMLSGNNRTNNGFSLGPAFSLAGGGGSLSPDLLFSVTADGSVPPGGGSQTVTPKLIGEIQEIFKGDVNAIRTPKDVMSTYNAIHRSTPISLDTAKKALAVLEKELMIKEIETGQYSWYDQLSHINQVAASLGRSLQQVTSLHELVNVVNAHLEGRAAAVNYGPLFSCADFYLADVPDTDTVPQAAGESIPGVLRIVLRMGGDLSTSEFADGWKSFAEDRSAADEIGGYESLVRGVRRGKERLVYVPDVAKAAADPDSFVRQESVDQYRRVFSNPGEVCWIVLTADPKGSKKCVGYLKFHRWNKLPEQSENSPFYSPNLTEGDRRTANGALENLATSIAEKINDLAGTKGVRAVWEEEETTLRRFAETAPILPVGKTFIVTMALGFLKAVLWLFTAGWRKKESAAAEAVVPAPAQALHTDAAAAVSHEEPVVLMQPAARILTADGRFNPEHPLPQNPKSYQEMMQALLDGKRVFRGDTQALEDFPAFRRPYKVLRRKDPVTGEIRTFQIYLVKSRTAEDAKRVCAPIANRLVFEWDLLSQKAAFDSYGQIGVSYDRKAYYEDRYLTATDKIFVFEEGMPVAFCVVTTDNRAFLEEKELFYTFIQAIMSARSRTRGMGITTYCLMELLSSIWMRNMLVKGTNNLVQDSLTGELGNKRFQMWVAAHSGRATVHNLFHTRFLTGDGSDRVTQAIIADADRRITTASDRTKRGLVIAPHFVDPGVYTPETRYRTSPEGVLIIPDAERGLATFPQWLEAIGGEEGVKAGNSLFFAGRVTFGGYRAERQRQRVFQGDSVLLKSLDAIRSGMVDRGTRKGG